ncbi:cysteine peptidase family C39 domain-containing protein, partial [uncultured Nostoc sp.]|uniref:cysteine peptidase family C39 domain-containing protein n=1 Tax=uncultured Nostoc sp. TaxID=340711 RepID=UPI0035C952DC
MKYYSILQHSEEDCGAATLATIAKYYGRSFALNRVREAVGTGTRGTTLLGGAMRFCEIIIKTAGEQGA